MNIDLDLLLGSKTPCSLGSQPMVASLPDRCISLFEHGGEKPTKLARWTLGALLRKRGNLLFM